MNPLLKLEKAWKEVTDLFIKTYFTYDDGSAAEGDWTGNGFGDAYFIGDYYFSGDDILTALRYKIPASILFKWYDDDYTMRANWKRCEKCDGYEHARPTVPNLKNFYLMTQESFIKQLPKKL